MKRAQFVLAAVVVVAVGLIVFGLWLQGVRELELVREQISYCGVLIQTGEVDKGIRGLRDVLDQDPGLSLADRVKTLRLLGRAYVETGRTEDAVRTFLQLIDESIRRAGERTEESAEQVLIARVTLAELLLERDPHTAIQHCEMVRNSQTRNRAVMGKALLILGLARYALKDFTAAGEYFYKLVNDYGDTEAAARGREELGRINVREILSTDPDNRWSRRYVVRPGDSLSSIAKAYGTTVEYLQRVNGLSGTLLRPGTQLKVPVAQFKLVVLRSRRALDLMTVDNQFVKRYKARFGRVAERVPAGRYAITTKSNTTQQNIPWRDTETGTWISSQDPNYPLGTRWMSLGPAGDTSADTTPGRGVLGIHGSAAEQSEETAANRGSISLRNEDVEELFELVGIGTSVEIRND